MLCFVIRWDMQRETCWRQRNTANHYLGECVWLCACLIWFCVQSVYFTDHVQVSWLFLVAPIDKSVLDLWAFVGMSVCWMANKSSILKMKKPGIFIESVHLQWQRFFGMCFYAGVWVFRKNNEKLPLTKTFSSVLMFSFTIQCGQMYRASLKIWSRSKQKEHFAGKKN